MLTGQGQYVGTAGIPEGIGKGGVQLVTNPQEQGFKKRPGLCTGIAEGRQHAGTHPGSPSFSEGSWF